MNKCIKTKIYGMEILYLETSKISYCLSEEQEQWLEELAIQAYYDKKEKPKEEKHTKNKKRKHIALIAG